MANSELSFASTQSFRNALMAKNLAPYNIPGVYSPQVSQLTYEATLSSYNVIDSPNNLITQGPFAQQLYPLNQYGPTGGYNLNINYNTPPNPVQSNQGIYDINDTKLDLVNEFYIDAAYIVNNYGPEGGFQNMVEITDLQNNNQTHLAYWSPPSFEPSTYSPYSILLDDNPVGDNGPLSNDSFIAKLGAERLKFAFQERVGAEIFQATIGAIDLESLKDPFEAALLVSGQQPLITKNYRITVPENPISRAALFALQISGSYYPVSPIPGDYFDENTKGGVPTTQTSTALNVVNSLTGGFLGPILNVRRNPSQIFLANTGNGQRSALFNNLDYNRYQPGYDRTFGGVFGVVQAAAQTALALLGLGSTRGGYYVGSKNSDPATITSPPNQIPVDPFGRQNPVPVYGPSELGILYEGNQGKINFGLPAKPSIEAGGVVGSFVWTSPKSKGGAGYKPTPGGGIGSSDDQFNLISNDYTKGESTEIEFKKSSILDQTQRLIESADNVSGISKLKHVGNAINQVSKVFNDGYKEMTKGSQVVSYKDNTTGEEVGIEYCRVFAKDTPYYTYADLQKSAGITKEGRRFSYSVLDSTYNLNIAPMKGNESTNIVKNNKGEFYAKKYMFSLENLAWRTSSKPGFTYDDLPDCEKGPNGGRVMWFPPYDLTFSDSSTANWQDTPFLGRTEPIYTYKNTTRNGQLSWRIVVDSPSVLNTLVDKQLKGQTNKKIDSILESFFAGCVKFDIYELAKKFNTFKVSELIELQEIITQPQLTKEEIEGVLAQIPRQNVTGTVQGQNNPSGAPTNVQQDNKVSEFEKKFVDYGFYFEDDYPKGSPATTVGDNYKDLYDTYTNSSNITKYENTSKGLFSTTSPQKDTTTFFENIVKKNWKTFTEGENSFLKEAEKILKEGNTIKVKMKGAASALGQAAYNVALSKRRISSVINYFNTTPLKKYIENKTFVIEEEQGEGEGATIPKSENESGVEINCTTDIKDKTGAVTVIANIYARDAMACRRVRVSSIAVIKKTETTTTTTTQQAVNETQGVDNPIVIPEGPKPVIDVKKKLKDGIGKKILRRLLSECDYFEMLKDDVPFVYDSIREKIKYFNPAFHSMTPEGLNARLTFLNQCVRPGETIPVIGPDGKPKFNDALNTAFGAPPILVLRIGDFYHTKIVPKSLQISYDPLLFDLNPEGIGVQPMIAKVSLNFDFIGGHGLARPVEQLQNALSFNYYANTEIYDERAVFTEDTSKLDKEIFDFIAAGEKSAGVENVEPIPERRGGKTIGDIATTVPVTSGETGFTTYQKVVDSSLSTSKQYFSTVYNTAEKISKQFNIGIWQLTTSERQFTEGEFLLAQPGENVNPITKKVEIFGKPNNLDSKIQFLSEKLLEDVRNTNNNYLIAKMIAFDIFKPAEIERLRVNLDQYISSFLNSFSPPLFDAIQTFTIFQQDMIQNFRKLNVVNSRTDGKLLESGKPFVYTVKGTKEVTQTQQQSSIISDTLQELRIDYENLGIRYNNYNTFINDVNVSLVTNTYPKDKQNAGNFNPLSVKLKNSSIEDKRMYMVLCRIFADKNKLIDFKNFLLREGLKDVNKFEKKLNKVCDDFADIVNGELTEQDKFFKKIKDNKDFQNYEKLDAFSPGKVRKFEYTTVPNDSKKSEQETLVKNVWSDVNVDSNKKLWVGKIKFD